MEVIMFRQIHVKDNLFIEYILIGVIYLRHLYPHS